MFNSIRPRMTNEECDSAKPIATGIIVHDSNLDCSSWLHRLWKFLAHRCFDSYELRVWQEYNPSGQQVWRAHDPRTGRLAYCHTEAEMVDWLEQRTRH